MNAESKAIADLIFVAARTPPDLRQNPVDPDEDHIQADLAVLIGDQEAAKLLGTNIGAVAMMTVVELRALGLSGTAASKLRAAFKLAIKAANEAPVPSAIINHPSVVAALMQDRVALLPHEEVWALFLTLAKRVKADLCISKSGFDSAQVDPQVIFHGALEVRSRAFILVHNHPSGDTTPSAPDRAVTKKLSAQGDILGIQLVDHVIIARGGFRSLAQEGLT